MRVVLPLCLVACSSGSLRIPAQELTLRVDAPVYGQFAGDLPVEVRGQVTDPRAQVWVEGRQVIVGTDGTFRVDLPIDGPYRIVDIEAATPKSHLRERLPVFSGRDPMETWPGGLSIRFTPRGLAHIGETLGATLDDLQLFEGIASGIGATATYEPIDVTLIPSTSGIALVGTVRDLVFALEIDLFGLGDLRVGFETLALGATLLPEVDPQGYIVLSVTDTTVVLGDPVLELGVLDPQIIEDLLGGLTGGLASLLDGVLDGVLGATGIPLGGPFDVETDLLGTEVSMRLDDLFTDDDGLAVLLGLDLGDADRPVTVVPAPSWIGIGPSDLTLGVHEGLFQALLTSALLDLLEQDLALDGVLGTVLGVTIEGLPGGYMAPENTGWCLSIDPGSARVARLQSGTDPLATLYLPDLRFDIGVNTATASCSPWLEASVALEIGFALRNGSELGLDLSVTEGVVHEYASTGNWTEDEVIASLGGLLEGVLGLVGGQLDVDLNDLLGGALGGGLLGDSDLTLLDAQPLQDSAGKPMEGLYGWSFRLWE
jgi:hypothetical protein